MSPPSAIHLTGLLLLAPYLTPENHAQLLARARFRTKREVEHLVAEIAPRADAPARIEPLGPRTVGARNSWQAFMASGVRALRCRRPRAYLGLASSYFERTTKTSSA